MDVISKVLYEHIRPYPDSSEGVEPAMIWSGDNSVTRVQFYKGDELVTINNENIFFVCLHPFLQEWYSAFQGTTEGATAARFSLREIGQRARRHSLDSKVQEDPVFECKHDPKDGNLLFARKIEFKLCSSLPSHSLETLPYFVPKDWEIPIWTVDQEGGLVRPEALWDHLHRDFPLNVGGWGGREAENHRSLIERAGPVLLAIGFLCAGLYLFRTVTDLHRQHAPSL
jgi:hypothetical protein